MSADFNRIKLLEFQQPLRCCNITAVAYSLSSLGYPTTVDDIFYQIRLPIGSVLDDGMTLSETYDACARYIEVVDLPLVVKVEHFDKPSMTLDAFIQEVEAGVEAESNIHILNFNTRIAHENPNLEGGHFALLADYDPKTQELTVADTNPKRYNRYWKCPVALMYQACVDKDSSSDRSRGMIVMEKTESRLG
jgi:Phytochelatin synthase